MFEEDALVASAFGRHSQRLFQKFAEEVPREIDRFLDGYTRLIGEVAQFTAELRGELRLLLPELCFEQRVGDLPLAFFTHSILQMYKYHEDLVARFLELIPKILKLYH